MSNVTNINTYSYLKERSDAVLLMWHEGCEHSEGWVKVTGVKGLAELALSMLEATPACQIGIQEAGRMTPDMSVEDFYETLGGLACEVGENPGWFKLNRESAEATIQHLIDIRQNPIHLDDFYPQA